MKQLTNPTLSAKPEAKETWSPNKQQTTKDFDEAVNMAPKELEDWFRPCGAADSASHRTTP